MVLYTYTLLSYSWSRKDHLVGAEKMLHNYIKVWIQLWLTF